MTYSLSIHRSADGHWFSTIKRGPYWIMTSRLYERRDSAMRKARKLAKATGIRIENK